MIIDSANLAILNRTYKAAFKAGFKMSDAYWDRIATLVPSSTKTNDYAWLGQFPKLREWVGDRVLQNMAKHGYSIVNKDFESTVEVDRNEIEDDTYSVYKPMMQELGYAAAQHPDELIFDLLAAAFATECYDGQYMIDTDHPVGSSTYSNSGGGSGDPWFLLDTRRPLKPLIFQQRKKYDLQVPNAVNDEHLFMRKKFLYGVDARCNVGFGFWQQIYGSKQTLDESAFNAAYKQMMNVESDEGRKLGIRPNLLVVGPSNRVAALEVVKQAKQASGEDNINLNAVEVLLVPHLG